MERIKIKYFDAKRSRYGDFLELGEFQNGEDFQAHLDQVSYDIKQEDADSAIPVPSFHSQVIDKDYPVPKDITEETACRLEAGLMKVPEAAEYIEHEIFNHNKKTSLVLCHFHEVAEALAKRLRFPVALNSKDVSKEFKRLAKEGGCLITTLGLTDSNLDLNECDNVYMVESTYTAMQDRQSIRRCLRLGKRTVVDVTYFMLKGELPLAKSMSRLYLGSSLKPANSSMGPSSLKRLEMCPGSYWIPKEDDNKFEGAAYFGTLAHSALERCLINPDIEISNAYSGPLTFAIEYCRSRLDKQHGIEDKVDLMSIHPEMYGTCDFWVYDDGHLEVYDYKNGVQRIPVKDNLQLLAYAAMVEKTHGLLVNQVTLGIIQKGTVDLWQINDYNVYKTINRIEKIVERIKAAKDNPLKHLKEGTCDFFCPATKYHIARRESEQLEEANREEGNMANRTTFKAEGKCIYYEENGERVTYGISSLEIPKEAIAKEFAANIKLIAKAFKYNKEYKNYSFFAANTLTSLPEDQRGINPKGKKVSLEFNINIADKSTKYPPKAFVNVTSVKVDGIKEEVVDLDESTETAGWGAGA